jgi:hypothetical protein
LRKVPWHDAAAQREAIRAFVAAPPEREAVRALVEEYTWQRVASEIANCYFELDAQLRSERSQAQTLVAPPAEAVEAKAPGTAVVPAEPEPERTLS